jgi:hypothetical protein
MFDKFPKYHMNILLGDFNVRVDMEDIFKPTTGNENLHKISNDNGVGVENVILRCLQMGKPMIRLTIF